MSKHVREKWGKLYISSFYVPKGALLLQKLTQIDDNRTWSVVRLNKVICKISAQYVKAWKRKVRKTVYFQYSKFQKGHNSYTNWRHSNLDLSYSKTKSYAKFQLNMSKHVREKCGKLCISSILSSKRGITPTKIDANWQHSNLICNRVKQIHLQNFNSICQSMKEKSAENCVFSVF